MSETKQTPGPWKAINCAVFSDKKGRGTYTVTVAVALSKVGMEEALANARLIAAAPELLAALKNADYRLTYLLSQQQDEPKEFAITSSVIDKVRAAIAKAGTQ